MVKGLPGVAGGVLRAALVLGLVVAAGLPATGLGEDAGFSATVDGVVLQGSTPLFLNASSPAQLDLPLHLSVPGGYWSLVHGGLALTAASADSSNPSLTVLDAHGLTVGVAQPTGLGGSLTPNAPTSDSVLVLRGVPSGDYTIRLRGSAAFAFVAQVQTRDQEPAAELLPDLVVLPITGVSATWQAAKVGAASCRPLEIAESVPASVLLRCLRFDTTVGNLGPGGLDLTIDPTDALRGLVCNTEACPVPVYANFTQVVERTDYGTDSYVVSPAIYHAGHNHYHIADFVVSTLYAFDNATRTRGAAVGMGHKDGFCPIDDGLIALAMNDTEQPGPSACQVNGGDITIRLDSNYWDQYPSSIDDQFVDITNVPGGLYELVTRVNPTGLVHEVDTSNNEARVLVRIDATGAYAVPGDAP
jgi:hypothetical protein